MKKRLVHLMMMSVVLVLAACGQGSGESVEGETSDADDTVKIGTLHYIDHESMTDSETGFYKALEDNGYVEGENLEVQTLSAQGTQSNLNTMAEQIADDNQLILAMGTAAAQALANVEQEKPIVFTAVTDPVDAGLVESQEEPGKNMTGSSDYMPVSQQIELLLSLDPEAEAVGVVYDQSEPNSSIQAEEAIQTIEDAGLEAVITTVTSTNDVQQNLSSIINDIDLLYAPTDNIIAATMSTVRELTVSNGIPSVIGAPAMVEEGGLATYGIDYETIGYQAGEIAVEIIEGNADPATTPYQNAKELELFVNEEVAEELGIDPASIVAPE